MKLAIIGSREFCDWELFTEGITRILEQEGKLPILVVSGGARGADRMGEKWAKDNGIKTLVFKPEWGKHGKRAGLIRNADIIENATHVLAFPSESGSGTQHALGLAKEKNLPIQVIYI